MVRGLLARRGKTTKKVRKKPPRSTNIISTQEGGALSIVSRDSGAKRPKRKCRVRTGATTISAGSGSFGRYSDEDLRNAKRPKGPTTSPHGGAGGIVRNLPHILVVRMYTMKRGATTCVNSDNQKVRKLANDSSSPTVRRSCRSFRAFGVPRIFVRMSA